MGFSLKKAFKGVSKAIKSVAKVAAPAIGYAVGGPAGAAIGGAVGGVASGGGLRGAVIGAGMSYAGTNLLTSAASAGGILQTAGQVADVAGKVANVFSVVKAMNSATGEVKYIGVGDTVPAGFTVDTTQAPITVQSPNYENNLGAAQPLNAQAVQAAAMANNTQAQAAKNNQMIMVVALAGMAYFAFRKGHK